MHEAILIVVFGLETDKLRTAYCVWGKGACVLMEDRCRCYALALIAPRFNGHVCLVVMYALFIRMRSGLVLAMIWCLTYIFLMRCIAGVMVWSTILLFIAVFAAGKS